MTPDELMVEVLMGDTPDLPSIVAVVAERQPWRNQAACKGQTELFFIEKGDPEQFAKRAEARAMCAVCPVAVECLEFALEHRDIGIWAGTTERERRMKRERRRAA